ncbi:NADPH-dependent FMN reductase [Xanthobacter sp. KR7-225]|uniref:NADPH-dependent FMN reductase n=1 Tax=Xanthobacter sp. KR7-225 TaxID=3156613 RepID=UPI0032B3BF75
MDQLAYIGKVRLLGLSGSIRSRSTNTSILRTLAERIGPRVELSVLDLGGLPPYNADLDTFNGPAAVADLRTRIADADGLVIASPEYNYGIPGVLKNAIDWASRPAFRSPLKGKPALVMTSSSGTLGGARAQAQIRETLASALCRVVPGRQIAVPSIDDKTQDGRLVHEPTIDLMLAAIAGLLDEIDLVAGGNHASPRRPLLQQPTS